MPGHPAAPRLAVRRARGEDAAALSAFAAEAFRDAFAAQTPAEDMTLYLSTTFYPERQAAEIADPASSVLLAEQVDAGGERALVGYARLYRGTAPAAVSAASPIELSRFYVTRAHHGTGIARGLFDAVEAEARAQRADAIWLGVFKRNPRAIAFYEKCGFTAVGEQTFAVGTDVQHDWIMARPIA